MNLGKVPGSCSRQRAHIWDLAEEACDGQRRSAESGRGGVCALGGKARLPLTPAKTGKTVRITAHWNPPRLGRRIGAFEVLWRRSRRVGGYCNGHP